jgi:hypothetical protein
MANADFQDEPPAPRRAPDFDEPDLRPPLDVVAGDPTLGLIPYKNPAGLVAYYLGVFGLIPVLGLILGPAALVCGIVGVRHAMRNPAARGLGHAITGIVLGGLETLANWAVFVMFGMALLFSR